ncbi:MAG: hypothetical protein ACI4GW_13745 [Lachnospiraceae bacterium]
MATNNNVNNQKQIKKRKRVNRIKSFIVLCAILLLFSSVILNFVLMFKVMHLENQIDHLYSISLLDENFTF